MYKKRIEGGQRWKEGVKEKKELGEFHVRENTGLASGSEKCPDSGYLIGLIGFVCIWGMREMKQEFLEGFCSQPLEQQVTYKQSLLVDYQRI